MSQIPGFLKRPSYVRSGLAQSILILLMVTTMGLSTTLADGMSKARGTAFEYSTKEVISAADADLALALAPFKLSEKFNQPTPQFARVRQLFGRVVSIAMQKSALARTLDWQVYVHDGHFAEAYSRASGKLVISARFLERYQPNDAELTFVIGHEIAHVLCEHERMNLSLVWRMNAPQELLPRYAMEFLDTEPMVRARLAPIIRLQETVADRVGLALATASGINPIGALHFFDKSAEKDRSGIFPDAHDLPGERKTALLNAATSLHGSLSALHQQALNCAP